MTNIKKLPHLLVERFDGENSKIAKVTLDNPEKKNAISYEMIDSLINTLEELDWDKEVSVVILTGAGSAFSAGGDIKAMLSKSGMFSGGPNELRENYQRGIQKIPLAIEKMKTPIIAMINGAAIGAGCDLACMCDLRIGSEKSIFGETFAKLSLVPGDGGTFFLPRVLGYSKAMEMLLTGDIYKGKKAFEFGLLNYFVDDLSKLEENTLELARKISRNSQTALSLGKKALKSYHNTELQSMLDMLAAFQGIVQNTDDHHSRLNALSKN